jgi:hypothetical protein
MKERRQYKRSTLTLPVRLEAITPGRKNVIYTETRDISPAGTFISTPESFPRGIRFKLDLTLSNGRINELTNATGLIECEGNIVRTTPAGIAIRFDRECQIMSLR